jgi:hypothetical protein
MGLMYNILLNGMLWTKFRFSYYARVESMMTNFWMKLLR